MVFRKRTSLVKGSTFIACIFCRVHILLIPLLAQRNRRAKEKLEQEKIDNRNHELEVQAEEQRLVRSLYNIKIELRLNS